MTKKISIVCFGDSITAAKNKMPDESKRWPNILQRSLSNIGGDVCFKVINSGVGGNSDREKIARLEKDVLTHNPDIVLLEFGGNNNDPNKPERRVSLEEMRELLEEYRSRISEKTKTVVITFPPLIEEQHHYYGHPFFKDKSPKEMLNDCRQITVEFARENNYPIIDLNKKLEDLTKSAEKNTYTLPDGIHLTEKGNAVLADMAHKAITNILKIDN